MHFLSRGASRFLLAATTTFALVACSDDPTGPVNAGRMRAVHAISNVTGTDVLFNSATYKANLAYKATDGYREISTGGTAIKFRKTGVATDLASANITVANGVDYTVIGLGTEAAPQSLVLVDSNTTPAAGKIKLRAVHAAASAGAADVYVLANANDLATATPAKTNLVLKGTSDYIVRDAGTYVIIYTQAGTKTPLLTINNVQAAAGGIRTVVAVEKAGGGAPLEGIVLTDR
jgi:hypothetical protein